MATTSCACFRWRARRGRVTPPRDGPRWSRSGSGASGTTEEIMREPLSIYVLVDALGWELVRGRPFLDDVLIDKRWLVTILGYSSGAIPSLLSGRYPNQHGHWNLFYRSPAASPFRWTRPLGRLPKPLVENPVSRRAWPAHLVRGGPRPCRGPPPPHPRRRPHVLLPRPRHDAGAMDLRSGPRRGEPRSPHRRRLPARLRLHHGALLGVERSGAPTARRSAQRSSVRHPARAGRPPAARRVV